MSKIGYIHSTVLCLLKFNVSFRHCYGHIGDRQKPGAGRQSPTLFDRLQWVF